MKFSLHYTPQSNKEWVKTYSDFIGEVMRVDQLVFHGI